MSLGSRLLAPFAFSALVLLAGCGNSSSPSNPTPPPSGGFSNASLNGTYTFSVGGQNSNGIFTMAGSFVACGCTQGAISSGRVDLNDPSGPASASSIGGNSSYHITSDGRGIARLLITTAANVAINEIDIDFVLTSTSHGLVIRFDGFGTGSGTIDLQPAAVSQTALAASPYVFFLSGADLNNLPATTVGAVTVSSTGAISTGVQDFNYNGTPSTQLAVSGSITVGTGTAPGSATLATSFGTLGFSVYAIDATHLKLIENDGQFVMVGDLVTQGSASIPAGTLVFTMSGLDKAGLFVTAGTMNSDGSSQITKGSEDVNDAGVVDNNTNPAAPFAFTGNFSSTAGGRFQVALTNYVGGTLFAAYPSSAGLFLMQIDTVNPGVTAGIAFTQQSGATLSASQGYGLNLTGVDLSAGAEFDLIAEIKTTSTAMTGLVDSNDNGSPATSNVNGTYSVVNGLGSASFTTGLPGIFFYPLDGSTAVAITTDPTVVLLGSFELQTAPGSSALASGRRSFAVPMSRVLPNSRSASQKNRGRFNRGR